MMKSYWTQPSLSRDFTFLATAVLFVLFLISMWVAYSTYSHYSKEVAVELEREAQRIDHTLATEMENARYLLSSLGKQLVLEEARDPTRLARVLKSFDNKGFIYSILSWVNTEQKLVVSSNKGVLEEPVDISDRDYVKKAVAEPWKMQIGRPIEGRVSERWVIPVSMGVTDNTGKFIGTIMLSIDINTMTEQLSRLIKKDGISFAIVSKTLIPLTQVSEDKHFVTNNFPTQKLVNVNFSSNPYGLLTYGSLFWGTGNYAYYKTSAEYPYIILLGYDASRTQTSARDILASRMLQIFFTAFFLISLLWIMRTRMIKPVMDMTALASAVARGEHRPQLRIDGPVEVNQLAGEVRRIGEYIEETKRIENELRNKVFMLKKAKEKAELDRRSKQLVLEEARDPTRLARVLKSFDNKGFIYSILSWVNTEQKLVVSSNKGVLEEPVDISDRDYVKKAVAEPWKMQIGRPIEGRVSERWVIPVSMGVTDNTGKFIGTIMLSIDINTMTEQLSRLIKKDGISFAIVSKTLIPLTQVSEDKHFVTNNFPTQKLVNVNFSSNPYGLLTYGSLFWGTGNYAYYKTSAEYPYIILLGYDASRTQTSARDILASRMLQIFFTAFFLISLLWIMRTRMIKPVMDMTALASAVARGEHRPQLRIDGPVEVNQLAGEVRRIGEYIEETKRIENELRNKVFMLKKAKEKAELDRRSKTEFLAYVCQEMRTSLNNIIGFSQVMRDQLYGPIENRKYRQYSADIYKTGNTLLSHMQDLLTLSKIETGYVDLVEKPQDVAGVLNKVLRFVADKLQTENLNVRLKLQDPLPRIVADEFRLQQMLMNLLLHMLQHMIPEQTLTIESRLISESKEKSYFAFILTNENDRSFPTPDLFKTIETLQDHRHVTRYSAEDIIQRKTDLSLELARSLVDLHQGYMDIQSSGTNDLTILVFFTGQRIVTG